MDMYQTFEELLAATKPLAQMTPLAQITETEKKRYNEKQLDEL
jgi:hypothetical protein